MYNPSKKQYQLGNLYVQRPLVGDGHQAQATVPQHIMLHSKVVPSCKSQPKSIVLLPEEQPGACLLSHEGPTEGNNLAIDVNICGMMQAC